MKSIILLLLPLYSLAQTWPSNGCDDRPYVLKRNSDTIYHTTDCSVPKMVIVSGSYETKSVKAALPKNKEIFCPVCDHFRDYWHVRFQIALGRLKPQPNAKGKYILTRPGEIVRHYGEDKWGLPVCNYDQNTKKIVMYRSDGPWEEHDISYYDNIVPRRKSSSY